MKTNADGLLASLRQQFSPMNRFRIMLIWRGTMEDKMRRFMPLVHVGMVVIGVVVFYLRRREIAHLVARILPRIPGSRFFRHEAPTPATKENVQ